MSNSLTDKKTHMKTLIQNSDPAFAIFFQRRFMSSTDGSQEKDTYDHGS
jgi:hypothetical protein